MTSERRIIVSLSDIKAVVFECDECKARTSIVPERFQFIPDTCPSGHRWASQTGEMLGQAPFMPMGFIYALKKLRTANYEKMGFRILLEFEELEP
jgi:hypothetical protein